MHWARKYLTISYSQMNCSKFVEFVLRDHFGIDYQFPQSEGSLFNQSLQIKQSIPFFAKETKEPKDGDMVLMHGKRMMCHVGIFVKMGRRNFVLHTESRMGCAALHDLRYLVHYGYSVGGFYTWLK